jgi:hypothetical protein
MGPVSFFFFLFATLRSALGLPVQTSTHFEPRPGLISHRASSA